MYDDQERTIYVGGGSSPSSLAWARINLEPKVYTALYGSKEDPDLEGREYILARITPRELVFIEHVCRHPEETDEEIMAALGIAERTVLAYYTHLGRNFRVRNSEQLRSWAFKNGVLRTPEADPGDEGPTQAFDPWVRWH
jgi:DNA-binding CsgD family transcriptional regulator